MKKNVFILRQVHWVVVLLLLSFSASGQKWQWATQVGINNYYLNDLAADASGNIYLTGSFSGNTRLGCFTLNSSGNSEMFLAKYDAFGQVKWAARAPGNNQAAGLKVQADAIGNSYVLGYYIHTIRFGNTIFSNTNTYSLFFAKYNTDGQVVWAKNLSGQTELKVIDFALDEQGNSYITGRFGTNVSFGDTTLIAVPGVLPNCFIAKYDNSGKLQWARTMDAVTAIATDRFGNSYITGYYYRYYKKNGFDLTSAGDNDIYFAKLDASGKMLWMKSAGGKNDDSGSHIAVDDSGNIFIMGSISRSAYFDHIPLYNSRYNNFFLAKYNSDVQAQWVKNIGGSDPSVSGRALAVDGDGNSYVTGSFTKSISIGDFDMTSEVTNMFVARYSPTGWVDWAEQVRSNRTVSPGAV